jgi:CxxC-x17-CxxC domain-containing protein
MEQYRDEHIACANCGASFLFSAGEAAVFAERSLAAPKRCKECRRARKEQGGAPQGRPAPAWGGNGGGGQRDFGQRGQAPRYTGDVNEYRSPMQDNSYGNRPAWGGGNSAGGNHGGGNGFGYAQRGPRPPMGGRPSFGAAPPGGARGPSRGGPPPWQGGGDGNYRAPSSHGGNGGYEARDNRFAGPPRGAPQDGGFAAGPPGEDAARMQRRRPTAEMFSITCNSCGVHAEVPFRPAEGRDVFCQACYRARKPT